MLISTRLWSMAFIMIAVLMGFGGFSWWATSSMSAKTNEIQSLSELRGQFNELMKIAVANREQYMLALQHNPDFEKLAALHDHDVSRHTDTLPKNQDRVKEILASLAEHPFAKQLVEKEMNDFLTIRDSYGKEAVRPGFDLIKSNQYQQASEHLLKKVNPAYAALESRFNTLIQAVKAEESKLVQENEALNTQVASTLLIVIIASLVMGLFMAWLGIKSITSAVSEIDHAIRESSRNMQFKQQLPHRLDEFAGMSHSLNHLFRQLDQGLNETNQVVTALSQGDMSQRISGDYVGDLLNLKSGVNTSADNIASVINELSATMNALKSGQFGISISTQGAGVFGQMLTDAQAAMSSINGVVSDINQIMLEMNKANFDKRVTSIAEGDLDDLKNRINHAMETTEQVIASIVRVVEAQAMGDLTAELPSGVYKGQFHDLKNAMAYAADKVKQSIAQAISASNIVNNASAQVSAGASDLSSRVQQQAAALEETSATMNQMAFTVQSNTATAKTVAGRARNVQIQAQDGASVMQETLTAMQSIKASSSKISEIVSLIDGIAFQTNLLALNAAVEAARAGEHGRGFAVVAGEVRALAQKSANAAKDIKSLIEDSVERIEIGTGLADKSGDMLNAINQAISGVADQIDQIARDSDEQLVGIQQVNSAIADIDRMTQENAALVEETTAASESLSSEANDLQENMSFFKTGLEVGVSQGNLGNKQPKSKASHSLALLASPKAKSDSNKQDWAEF